MTGAGFRDFRARMGWTKKRLAEELEIDRRSVARYEEQGAPRHIALACAALAQGLPPMP